MATNYFKIEKEDKEDIKHRKAQFLIYKSLKKADSVVSMRKNSYWLKIKIGRKLNMLKKSILFTFSSSRIGFYKQFICQLKFLKSLIGGKETIVSLPPVFTSSSFWLLLSRAYAMKLKIIKWNLNHDIIWSTNNVNYYHKGWNIRWIII